MKTSKTEEKVIKQEKDDFVELLKTMAVAALIALSIRTVLFEPFNIPSGSMFPTLLVGDFLFVEKYSYGYSTYSFPLDMVPFSGRIFQREVTRGDVVVFRQPKKVHIDYIKRIIGLPGDKIQVRDGILRINGKPVTREFVGNEEMEDGNRIDVFKKYIETLPNGVRHYIYEISDGEELDDTPVYTVPPGNYFAMGDNRDQSMDSRVQAEVGFIPERNLIGRAAFLFFSVDSDHVKCSFDGAMGALKTVGCKLVEWPRAIRFKRLFKVVNEI